MNLMRYNPASFKKGVESQLWFMPSWDAVLEMYNISHLLDTWSEFLWCSTEDYPAYPGENTGAITIQEIGGILYYKAYSKNSMYPTRPITCIDSPDLYSIGDSLAGGIIFFRDFTNPNNIRYYICAMSESPSLKWGTDGHTLGLSLHDGAKELSASKNNTDVILAKLVETGETNTCAQFCNNYIV